MKLLNIYLNLYLFYNFYFVIKNIFDLLITIVRNDKQKQLPASGNKKYCIFFLLNCFNSFDGLINLFLFVIKKLRIIDDN